MSALPRSKAGGAGAFVGVLAVWLLAAGVAHGAPAEDAAQILAAAGVKGGLIVHLGCGDGRLTVALHASDACLVQGLDADAKNVEAARKTIRAAGLYGPVSADRWTGDRLPYIENLVNLVVISERWAWTRP